MKPIKNETSTIMFQPGDLCSRGKILNLHPCCSAFRCRKTYKNFEVCGGFERLIEGYNYSKCIFWVVDRFYLSDVRGGRRLG